MKIENYLLLVVLIIFNSCNQPNTKGETADSAQLEVGSVASKDETTQVDEPVKPDEPPIDASSLAAPEFDYYSQTISTDKRESNMINKLAQLVKQFKDEKYATITMSYTHDDAVVMGKVKENETWYYNANRQLCAHTSEYKSERTTETRLYLCRNGEVMALSSDNEFQDEGPRAFTNVKIVSSECPQCGLNISSEDNADEGNNFQVTELDQSDLGEYSNDFFSKHNDILKDFKDVSSLTKIGDRYSALVFVNSDTVKYSIDPNLVNKFFKKGLIQN